MTHCGTYSFRAYFDPSVPLVLSLSGLNFLNAVDVDCSGYYLRKSFEFSPEEPDACPSALESSQYRSHDHHPSSFLCEIAHAPKRFAQRLFLCDLQKGEFAVS